jgi:hypothetical protein
MCMNISVVVLSFFLALPVAHAKPRTAHASYAQMKQDAEDFLPVLDKIEGCNFQVQESVEGGIRLSMKSEAKGLVFFDVMPQSSIILESGDEDREDGSFSKSYKVAGSGELDVVHANDAFLHAYLTGTDGRTLSCEIDF